MFSAMVLSAGLGTRLAPLTDELPKPLVPVGDRPLLLAILQKLVEGGAENLAVNVHYKPEKISNALVGLAVKVHVLREATIRGTAGGVRGARDILANGPALVVNGDIFGALPITELLAAPPPSSGLTLAVTPRALGEGTVGIGERGQVVRLRTLRAGVEVRSGDYMGVARLEPSLLGELPEVGCLIGDVALPRIAGGLEVRVVEVGADFVDVGSLDGYLAANRRWLEEQGRTHYLGPLCRVAEGVELRGSVVGAGAVVEGEGSLEDCVVWPGARARAPLSRAVVLGSGRVVVGAPS